MTNLVHKEDSVFCEFQKKKRNKRENWRFCKRKKRYFYMLFSVTTEKLGPEAKNENVSEENIEKCFIIFHEFLAECTHSVPGAVTDILKEISSSKFNSIL